MAAVNVESILSFQVFCPLIRFRRKTARGPVWFQEAMFPGYIFVRFDMSDGKRAVEHSPGIMGLPMFGDRYVAVPESVIDSLKADLDDQGSVNAALPLAVGDETTILEGSMRGLRVKVIKVMPAEDRVSVLLELLGTLVEAEFPSDVLEHRNRHRISVD
ncbi:MAG: hypothetical protein JXR25_06805 [Pontiellaceae bacterium]|nr:hypothetical protein [Pontiellaceae bacterium]MBN2784520.1 hypothetical protein [Pontiellaceae bacterium]